MEKGKQLELLKDSKDTNETTQFNVAISKKAKKKFLSFCLENDLVAKEAAENALLEFVSKHESN